MARARRIYSEEEFALQRCAHRLRDELGINTAGVEVILRLRQQMLEMQSDMALLQAQLAHQSRRRGVRLARYRESHFEAIWSELIDNS